MKPTVLILCTGNSCRSHIAEGSLRAAVGELIGRSKIAPGRAVPRKKF